MSDLVERVARAIYEADDPWHTAWPWPDLQSDQAGVDQYRRIAEAAIAAMQADADHYTEPWAAHREQAERETVARIVARLREVLGCIASRATKAPHRPGQIKAEHRSKIHEARTALAGGDHD